ncbi:MAG: hypothetical protein CMI54_05990 [Parcubacteria group bacterium]|nr:hypothetical protein [Parcubacteria group bacterium]|tara:strand:- start:27440 stop:27838 length:399 start_codon:yes stop_codon:yes gene_type:complete
MNCFFPAIFKKNTYKKVRFFTLGLILALVLLSSGCKIARSVVSAPFRAVGWGATKISKVVGGEEKDSKPKLYKLNSDGSLTEKNVNDPKLTMEQGGDEINFKLLIVWGITLIGVAMIVRFLMNKYVYNNTKE